MSWPRLTGVCPSVRCRRFAAVWPVALVAALCVGNSRGAGPPEATDVSTLQLRNGDIVSGRWLPSEDASVLRWQGAPFVSPFEFALTGVAAVSFPVPKEPPQPEGAYCFELTNGDVCYGSLERLDSETIELELPRLGRVQVPPGRLRRFSRWNESAGLIYLGPNGLADWSAAPQGAWRDEGGRLVTVQPGATLLSEFKLPPRAAIELEISWTQKPEFILALGVGNDDESVRQAFRMETWDGELVLLRETARDADLAELRTLAAGADRLRLQIYLDQIAARCLVVSESGAALADLTIAGDGKGSYPLLKLLNRGTGLQLERLRIRNWNGQAPLEADDDATGLHLVDGTIVRSPLSGYDAATREFIVGAEGARMRLAADRVDSVLLSAADVGPPEPVTATYQDAARFSGELVRVDDNAVWLSSPAFGNGLRLPRQGMRSVSVRANEKIAPAQEKGVAVLEIEGVKLRGRLIDGSAQPGASCLVWQPQGSRTAGALRPGATGRILFREPKRAPRASADTRTKTIRVEQQEQVRARQVAAMAAAARVAQAQTPVASAEEIRPRRGDQKSIYLRSGDSVPGEVTRIDERGVTIKTAFSDATLVPHEKVKAAELADESPKSAMLTKIKRDRLLTLPRMQRENPPTHLIRSKEGDYLRGRILQMDDVRLILELRLERREIARDRIARIIWLHPEELGADSAAAQSAEPDTATRVQAVHGDGVRLTFIADRLVGNVLSGKSDVLGDCQVPLDKVEQLIVGGAIEQAASRLAYQQWKLQHAVDPAFVRSEDNRSGDGRESGTESEWVGKTAPEFELPMLEGGPFRLATQRGRIVVLDFFTTWCGPCLEELPHVDQVRRDFAQAGVQVVAVNMEEAAPRVASLLERRKLQLPVALDRDGAVAAKYSVTTIPQLFVIDREGKIARHYINAGRHLGEDLAEALRELTADKTGNEPGSP
ncbi:MAG: TlpA family protein disulfide reductase [Planctomycetaceae bacterium]|nr:TlpA family protein disulfide reductase [Planctomycetaceae bacterium]